jgi:ATP-dependent protease ClpP protease subunit
MTTTYVIFQAPIDQKTSQHLIASCINEVHVGATEIYLAISTAGGNVMSGITMYNILKALPVKLTTHNVGNVDSIGNAVFLAGERRIACSHSTFMFHGVGCEIHATRFEEKNLNEIMHSIAADQTRISGILQDRTSLAFDEIRELFKEGKTKDVAAAKEAGIIHEIAELQIPPGARTVSMVF